MRRLPLLALVGAALLGAAGPAAADELTPITSWDAGKARHLLARAGFGGTPEDVATLCAMGPQKAVEFLVDYRTQPDVDLASPVTPVEPVDPAALAKLTPDERLKANQKRQRDEQQQMNRVREWWVTRMVRSPRPLEEKLVLFWHGHFANEFKTVRSGEAMYAQNQLFRTYAAGNFGKLLHAIIRDPAMLRYLDNNRNTKNRPNENLAREIMELFAMGVDQGYTEADIKEGARALTGHAFDPRTWAYRYNANAHDTGSKTLFGRTGKFDGDQFVDLILGQPATARFVARKLFVYFAHDAPSGAVIDKLAGVIRSNNYELAPALKALFRSEEFYSARSVGTQIKSPVQLVVGTARALRMTDIPPAFVATATRAMGQELFEPPNVKGWEAGRAWINANTAFTRANFPAQLLASATAPRGKAPAGPAFDPVAYLGGKSFDTPAAVVDEFARALFAVPLPAERKAELARFLGPLPPSAEWSAKKREVNAKLAGLLVLMMSLPEYQLT
jgi:uncharacterized protein (DUF1800 family)